MSYKVAVDSNRVIAALIKESTTRNILYNKNFEFLSPEFVKEETLKYKQLIIKKTGLTTEEFDILLSLFFERISLIPRKEYDKYVKRIEKEISDKKDIPYIACCMAVRAIGIWTHDPHFLEQKKIKILTNKDLLDMIRT